MKYDSELPAASKEIKRQAQIEKYRRRVENIESKRVQSPFIKRYNAGVYALSFAIAVYSILYIDFGPEEHCFSGIRRWVDQKKREFWTLSDEEKKELKQQGKLR
ncbi:hypothetical protein G9A89_004557 [Geosiphon pyriformis]|nr:hypothetical protein G9A89_004557 [Geosiphon pyriformis]